jgi:hypothetical protein
MYTIIKMSPTVHMGLIAHGAPSLRPLVLAVGGSHNYYCTILKTKLVEKGGFSHRAFSHNVGRGGGIICHGHNCPAGSPGSNKYQSQFRKGPVPAHGACHGRARVAGASWLHVPLHVQGQVVRA